MPSPLRRSASASLHLVKPLGFEIDDRKLKREGGLAFTIIRTL